MDCGNCFFPHWASGAETVAQTQNNWVTLFSQSTFSHGFLKHLPLRSTSDISWHPHSPGMLTSTKTKSRPHSYPPPACILQDVFTLHKCNITSSYTFSTTEPKSSDLEPTCVAPTRSFTWTVTVWSSLPEMPGCQREKESSPTFRFQVELAGWTTCTWVHSCACTDRAAISNWVFNFKG